MDDSARLAAIEGWYTLDANAPHFLGSRCTLCGTHYFPPREGFCSNPDCAGADRPAVLVRVPLSRTGTLWSYTDARYRPPEPYISPDPFQPFAIAAVRLDEQAMIVLGQVTAGVGVEQLRVGMRMEVVLETLYTDTQSARLVWKWKPMEGAA